MATLDIDEAAYEPGGESALARTRGLRVRHDIPLEAIRALRIVNGPQRALRFEVEGEGGKRANFVVKGAECGHLVEALSLQLGERCDCRFDPERLNLRRPRPRPVLAGLLWLGAGVAAVVGTILTALSLSEPPWVLFILTGVIGLLTAAYGARQVSRGLRQRLVLRAKEPFRSTFLSILLKVVGLIVFLFALYLPSAVFLRLFWVGELPPWAEEASAGLFTNGSGQIEQFKFIIFGLLGALLMHVGHRVGQRSGQGVLARDPRPPVLYLRAFEDDGRHDLNPRGFMSYVLGLRTFEGILRFLGPLGNLYPLRILRLLLGLSGDTSEEQLAGFFRRLGPVVAIGRPGEGLTTSGAARLYVDNQSWQERVLDLIGRARLVILQPSTTKGVWWEIEQCIQRLPSEKLLLCLTNLVDSAQAYEKFRLRFEELTGKRLPRKLGNAQFLAFGTDWTPRLIAPRRRSELLWPLTGVGLDFRSMFQPFLPSPSAGRAAAPPRPRRFGWVHILAALMVYGLGLQVFNFVAGSGVAAAAVMYELVHGPTRTLTGSYPPFRFDLSTAWRKDNSSTQYSLVANAFGSYEVVADAKTTPGTDPGPVADAFVERLRANDLSPRVTRRQEFQREGHRWLALDVEANTLLLGSVIFYYQAYAGPEGTFEVFTSLRQWAGRYLPGAAGTMRRVLDGFHLPDPTPEQIAAVHAEEQAVRDSLQTHTYEDPKTHSRLTLQPGWRPVVKGTNHSFQFGPGLDVILAVDNQAGLGDVRAIQRGLLARLGPVVGEVANEDFTRDGHRWHRCRWDHGEGSEARSHIAEFYAGDEGTFSLIGTVRHTRSDADAEGLRLIERGFAGFQLPLVEIKTYTGKAAAYQWRLPPIWQPGVQPLENIDQYFKLDDLGETLVGVIVLPEVSGDADAFTTRMIDLMKKESPDGFRVLERRKISRKGGTWVHFVHTLQSGTEQLTFIRRTYVGPEGIFQVWGGTTTEKMPVFKEAILASFEGFDLPPAKPRPRPTHR